MRNSKHTMCRRWVPFVWACDSQLATGGVALVFLSLAACSSRADGEEYQEPADGPAGDGNGSGPIMSSQPAVGSSAPCEGVARRAAMQPTAGSGTLRIPLLREGHSGKRYRLQNATFTLIRLSGVGETTPPEYPSAVSVGAESELDQLDTPLPSGEYIITLGSGWSLLEEAGAGATLLPAALLSPQTTSFQIGAGAVTRLRTRFEVSLPGSALAPAELAPQLDILERPQPLTGRVCIESSIAPEGYVISTPEALSALEGCSEVQGSLYIQPDSAFDLGALGELHHVCGTLGINSQGAFANTPAPALSLTGLEALEAVDSLYLSHPGVSSLAPLRSLRRIQPPGTEVGLGLHIAAATLDDLSGLENVTEIEDFTISDTAQVTSLRGLTLPVDMGSVNVSGPGLTDLAALANVERIQGVIRIVSTGVENLSELSSLREVRDLGVFANARLLDASLESIESSDYVAFYDNPSLQSVALPSLGSVGQLSLSALPALDAVVLPALRAAGDMAFEGDPLLEQLSLPALTRVSGLTIRNNTSLELLDLSALVNALAVTIVGNPALELGTLPGVDVSSPLHKIGLNAGEPAAPLAPCPWPNDNECDEGSLCAAGSDSADCSAQID